jgi:hypothetical protein
MEQEIGGRTRKIVMTTRNRLAKPQQPGHIRESDKPSGLWSESTSGKLRGISQEVYGVGTLFSAG